MLLDIHGIYLLFTYTVINFAFCFQWKKNKISNYDIGNWRKTSIYFVFVINYFKKVIEYFTRNCYSAIVDQVFRQILGIVMGTDSAPFFANVFLFYCESQVSLIQIYKSNYHELKFKKENQMNKNDNFLKIDIKM